MLLTKIFEMSTLYNTVEAEQILQPEPKLMIIGIAHEEARAQKSEAPSLRSHGWKVLEHLKWCFH